MTLPEPFISSYPGHLFAGVDEVGRGPLAWDVVAAAVILDPERPIDGLNDSKKLSAPQRERLFDIIQGEALAIGIGESSPLEIDEINILQAALRAMSRAVQQLVLPVDKLLVDGNKLIPAMDIPQKTVIGGDGKSLSIAAASIIAKVTRDRVMHSLDEQYPQYGFTLHKGYATRAHYAALAKWGPTNIHRRSFRLE